MLDLITAISFINLEDFYSTFLSNNGIDIKIIGIIIFTQLILSSIIGAIIHNVFKKINKLKVYMIFSILHIIFPIVMYIQSNLLLVPILYILSQLSFALYAPVKYEIFQANINNNVRSTILSIKSLFIAIGGIISYFIVFLLGKYFTIEKITIILLTITLLFYIVINIIIFKDIKNFYKND